MAETKRRKSPPTRLVLFAHGSHDGRWRRTFERILERTQQLAGTDCVRLAYMDFVGPGLFNVAEEAVSDGIRRLRLLPLFMSQGGHVARDLPTQVAEVRHQYPDIDIEVLPAIGEEPRVFDLLVSIAVEQLP